MLELLLALHRSGFGKDTKDDDVSAMCGGLAFTGGHAVKLSPLCCQFCVCVCGVWLAEHVGGSSDIGRGRLAHGLSCPGATAWRVCMDVGM